jgi:Uma2 family endonuclease
VSIVPKQDFVMTLVADRLLTVEEFTRLPDPGRPTELVRGRIVEMNRPTPRHGQIGNEVAWSLNSYVRPNELGEIVINDAGVITERDPDTMRGADVAFYSKARFGPGRLPDGYLDKVPDLVFEVLSESDRWSALLAKVAEYLDAGVTAVCILDPKDETAYVYQGDRPVRILSAAQDFTIPGVLGDFRVQVAKLFR